MPMAVELGYVEPGKSVLDCEDATTEVIIEPTDNILAPLAYDVV